MWHADAGASPARRPETADQREPDLPSPLQLLLDLVRDPEPAENALTVLLEQAQASDLADPGIDARTEAISLLATAATTGTSTLVGQEFRPPGAPCCRTSGIRPLGPNSL